MSSTKNRNTHGKRPKAKPEGPAMAASIGAAAGMIGCHLSVLQKAKRSGAPGFRSNGSVNITEVKEWLATQAGEEMAGDELDKEKLECRKLLRQCEKLEFQLAVERGAYTANADLQRDMIRIGSATRASLQRLRGDAPTWEGLPAADIERRVSERIEEICADLHEETSRLYA